MKNKDYVSITVLCHCNGFVPGRADVSPAIAEKLIAEGNAEKIEEAAETKILEVDPNEGKASGELEDENKAPVNPAPVVNDTPADVDGITDSNKGDQ